MMETKDEQITILTNNIINRIKEVEKRTQKPTGSQVKELNSIANPAQKAVSAIIILVQLGIDKVALNITADTELFMKEVVQLVQCSEEIKEGLRSWQMYRENILFLLFRLPFISPYSVKKLVDVLGEDMLEQTNYYNQICLTVIPEYYKFSFTIVTKLFNKPKYFHLVKSHWLNELMKRPSFDKDVAFELFDYFEWKPREKLAWENTIKLNEDDTIVNEQQTKLWLLLAQKFPDENDVAVATQKLKLFLGTARKCVAEKLFMAFPKQICLTAIMPDNNSLWPRSNSKIIHHHILSACRRIPIHEITDKLKREVSKFHADLKHYLIRNFKTPKWILEIFANNIVPNSKDFFSLANQRSINDNSLIYNELFNFEELPSDIIYCIVRLLSYKQIVPLSLTNKRIHSVLLKDDYIMCHYIKRYFTGVAMQPSEFQRRLKSREKKYRLMKHLPENAKFKSLELGKNDLLIANLQISRFAVNSQFANLTWYRGFENNDEISTVANCTMYDWPKAPNLSARLYKHRLIFAINGNKLRILIANPNVKYSLLQEHEITSDLINTETGFFQLKHQKLIGCGYWMDLTTNQIQPYPWTTDLYTVQMHSDDNKTGYGLDKSCKWLQQFDARTPSVTSSQSVVNVRDGVVQNFAVRNDSEAMFVVARHVSEWDRRFLHAPVRMSTDPNLTYSEHWGQYRPAIDLTSMKVIGREQIWDLADFTWKFDQNLNYPIHTASNGQFCVYGQRKIMAHTDWVFASLNFCRMGCNSYLGKDYYFVP